MALILKNLNERTRKEMLSEVEMDIKNGVLYISERLNIHGKEFYPALLIESIKNGDDSTLANALRKGLFNPTYQRKNPKGGFTNAKMPVNAPESLAEGEFNRFYIRALCKIVIETGEGRLKVYRARLSQHPRPESERKIGYEVDAIQLLNDLRNNVGTETYFGVPNGPMSGLSVELI